MLVVYLLKRDYMGQIFHDLDSLKEHLCDMGYEETIVFDNPSYVTAAVGVTDDGRVVYDYDLMVDYLVGTDNMEPDEAMEFIDYNTIRAIPYFGDNAPIVIHMFEG